MAEIRAERAGVQWVLYAYSPAGKNAVGRRFERLRPMPDFKSAYETKGEAEDDAARINQYIQRSNQSARHQSRQEADQQRLDEYVANHKTT
jgi:hypothetical protein